MEYVRNAGGKMQNQTLETRWVWWQHHDPRLTVGAASRDDRHGIRSIGTLEAGGDVTHHALEGLFRRISGRDSGGSSSGSEEHATTTISTQRSTRRTSKHGANADARLA